MQTISFFVCFNHACIFEANISYLSTSLLYSLTTVLMNTSLTEAGKEKKTLPIAILIPFQ